MSAAEVARIVGHRPFIYAGDQPKFMGPVPHRRVTIQIYDEDGPITLYVQFDGMDLASPRDLGELKIIDKSLSVDESHARLGWHMRRWAEQAWTAIHGPRPMPPDKPEFHGSSHWWD